MSKLSIELLNKASECSCQHLTFKTFLIACLPLVIIDKIAKFCYNLSIEKISILSNLSLALVAKLSASDFFCCQISIGKTPVKNFVNIK